MNLSDFLSAQRSQTDQHQEAINDRLVWIDHRDDEEGIVDTISSQMSTGDYLKSRTVANANGMSIWVEFNSGAHRQEQEIRLTVSERDRYLLLGSLAVLLNGFYRLFVLRSSLDADTHAIAVLKNAVFDNATNMVRTQFLSEFEEIEKGKDYFNLIQIPFLGAPNNSPTWELESERQTVGAEQMIKDLFNSPEVKGQFKQMRWSIFKALSLALLVALTLAIFRSRWLKIILVVLVLFVVYKIWG